jgi:hypothetical protein
MFCEFYQSTDTEIHKQRALHKTGENEMTLDIEILSELN